MTLRPFSRLEFSTEARMRLRIFVNFYDFSSYKRENNGSGDSCSGSDSDKYIVKNILVYCCNL